MSGTTETTADTTTTTTTTTQQADNGASFRKTEPKNQPTTNTETSGEGDDVSKDKEETITVQQGRFGVATTKTATKSLCASIHIIIITTTKLCI